MERWSREDDGKKMKPLVKLWRVEVVDSVSTGARLSLCEAGIPQGGGNSVVAGPWPTVLPELLLSHTFSKATKTAMYHGLFSPTEAILSNVAVGPTLPSQRIRGADLGRKVQFGGVRNKITSMGFRASRAWGHSIEFEIGASNFGAHSLTSQPVFFVEYLTNLSKGIARLPHI